MKKVSIITATYNVCSKKQKTFFYEMFRSIHEQDYPNIEHVIIDGGSTDGSVEFIKDIIKKYAKKEVVFISEKDNGINDATNKGYNKSSGDYVTLMCDDDYYIRKDAISILVKTLEENEADLSCADSWWLNKRAWRIDINSWAHRHPFLINALLLKRELLKDSPYLDENYPLCADYDLFLRLLSNEKIKGSFTKEVLTVLRPGGFSQSNDQQYFDDTFKIYHKYLNPHIFGREEVLNMHFRNAGLITLLKVFLFCKNKKFKQSFKTLYTVEYMRRYCIARYKRFFFYFFSKYRPKRIEDPQFSQKAARAWIETFYECLY